MTKPDLQFYNAGSFVTCTPLTERGRDWVGEHIRAEFEFREWFTVEGRYLEDIVLGARADGLICAG